MHLIEINVEEKSFVIKDIRAQSCLNCVITYKQNYIHICPCVDQQLQDVEVSVTRGCVQTSRTVLYGTKSLCDSLALHKKGCMVGEHIWKLICFALNAENAHHI